MEFIFSLILIFLLLIFLIIKYHYNKDVDQDDLLKLSNKIKNLEKQAQHFQDTLDHYGIRMSNKIPDKNKYYKRWYK